VSIGGSAGDTTRAPGDTARRPPPRPGAPRTAGDTLAAGAASADTTTGADTTALVTFAEDDSTMKALRARPGYDVVRYQGDTVRFLARDRLLTLGGQAGKPAAVERGAALLVGRTVRYDDSLRVVTATADSTAARDSVVLRDPSQGADVVVRSEIRYDLVERRGIVRGFSTSVAQGETWFVSGGVGVIVSDTAVRADTAGGPSTTTRTFYAHDGRVTSCDESAPHYHFQARDIKFVSKRLLVIRPAVLYIGNVPVLWLPFVFQDTRPGRRSGLLRPTFGVAELLRNSPSYQRSVRNLGYYTTVGDYADVRAWLDYRSGARPGNFGFGFTRYNVQSRYKVIDRFVDGDAAVGYERQSDGRRNLTVSVQHAQAFNQNRKFNANINFAQNTSVQRRNQFDFYQATANIGSSAAYSDRIGPLSLQLGGTAKQYPGQPQRDLTFPTLNVTSPTLSVTPWLDWTPGLTLTNTQSFRLTQGPQFATLFRTDAAGRLDSARINASTRGTQATFATPVKIRGFSWENSFTFTENVQDFPTLVRDYFRDINDSTTREPRVFSQTFQSNLDWNTAFALPSAFQGTWNVTPSISFTNVGDAGLFFRTERSGGRWVRGQKRPSFSLSAAPTFYAFAPGVFGVERFRHSVNTGVAFSYAPGATLSDEYLQAKGILRQGFFGATRQSRVALTVNTNLEAKLRARAVRTTADAPDSARTANGGAGGAPGRPGALAAGAAPLVEPLSGGSANAEGRKLKVLSLQFSPLSYDFARSDTITGRLFSKRGFVDRTFQISGSTDLVPGLSFSSGYELFNGDPATDSATFKPYRTSTNLSFQLDRSSALLGAVTRLFGLRLAPRAEPSVSPTNSAPGARAGGDPQFAAAARAQRVAGSDQGESGFGAPTQDFQLSVTYQETRQRNDIRGTLTRFNPGAFCSTLGLTGTALTACQDQALTNPQAGDTTFRNYTRGQAGQFFDPVRTLNANSSFHITQKWSAQWNTVYDVVRRRFASNGVQLARELHDWRANFGYTAAPNGNSAFSFFISLKAQPDVSLPYNRQTVRAGR
jgi:hypothetical protein